MDLAKLETMKGRALALASDLLLAKCAADDVGCEEAYEALEQASDKVEEARNLIAAAISSLSA